MNRLFRVSRKTRILLISVISISIISFLTAYLYYSGINKSEDPRVVPARYMFSRYDQFVKESDTENAFRVLDSIEQLYARVPGYSDSFEPGLIKNDRASLFIKQALYETHDSVRKSELLDTAMLITKDAIRYYENWIQKNGTLNQTEILKSITPFFPEGDPSFQGKNYKRILQKRVKDIILAQHETPRRLSVAYTNLGIIQRHQYKQNEAIESYTKAMKLWKDNPTALSNLNVLFGKPPKDRTFFQKLFPPDKNK